MAAGATEAFRAQRQWYAATTPRGRTAEHLGGVVVVVNNETAQRTGRLRSRQASSSAYRASESRAGDEHSRKWRRQ
jgi:hypothetical protein